METLSSCLHSDSLLHPFRCQLPKPQFPFPTSVMLLCTQLFISYNGMCHPRHFTDQSLDSCSVAQEVMQLFLSAVLSRESIFQCKASSLMLSALYQPIQKTFLVRTSAWDNYVMFVSKGTSEFVLIPAYYKIWCSIIH